MAAPGPRLAVATGIFHPEPGGPATYLHEILPALQARGWQVRLLTYGSGDTSGYPYPVTRIPRRALPLRTAHYGLASVDVLRWADVVYTHTIDLPLIGSGAPRLIKIVGDQAWERCIRKGWVPPDMDIDAFQQGDVGRLARQQIASRSRQVRAMDGVIVPSDYLKRMVIGWGVPEQRVHRVYNALPPYTGDRLSRDAARARLGWDSAPAILTAARLEAWKGVQHLVAALPDVPHARLYIAGDGPLLAALKSQAAPLRDRVRFLGRLSRADLATAMQAADLFALYSGYEGLSHSLLESLQLGTPVIASDKGGNPEVVRHGVNGLLVPYVDGAALAAALREGLAQREALAAHAADGLARFDFVTMLNATDKILREALPTG